LHLIGVVAKKNQTRVVEEFFELFKTPWEFYRPERNYDVVIASADEIPEVAAKLLVLCGPDRKSLDARLEISPGSRHQGGTLLDGKNSFPVYRELSTLSGGNNATGCIKFGSEKAGLIFQSTGSTVVRLGYDLFDEVEFLLTTGQPVENAATPTLDLHIEMLRQWILRAEVAFVEVSPTPAQYRFIACLTHDIDFIAIRNHFFDHSMLGFVYRATVGNLRSLLRGKISFGRLCKGWFAVLSLPFVYAGWAKDFWEPFEWYLQVEKDLPATYFLIPFKRRAGEKVASAGASRRATAYDVSDLGKQTANLLKHGCELGVHGIDSWHSVEKGSAEMAVITSVTGKSSSGIRMHWLLNDSRTPAVLEQAGYTYDSTVGYNETVGYRAGTSQVFRPLSAQTLLELPMHIQDGALFYPQRLDLTEPEAEKRCQVLIDNANTFGGVLTLLWHDRSHGPERFWGEFYAGMVQNLKSANVWFASAGQVVHWFQKRRDVQFEKNGTSLGRHVEPISPPLNIRVHHPRNISGASHIDLSWDGTSNHELERSLKAVFEPSVIAAASVPVTNTEAHSTL